MSNTFKQNSRFSALIDDNAAPPRNEKPKPRGDYSDRPQRNRYTDKYTGGDQFDRNKQNQELRIKANAALQLELTDENFPSIMSLNTNKAKPDLNYTDLFASLSSNEPTKVVVDANIETLAPGWVSLKKDPASNKIIWRENKSKNTDPVEKSENELATEALDALVELYDRRDNEFIDTWGYEEWERTFRFPNYDYEYFDRLDELAEDDLEAEENNQDELNEMDYNDSFDRWN
jgi:hypothetical protein